MLVLEELAAEVVRAWEGSDLDQAVRLLAEHLNELESDRLTFADHIERAQQQFADEHCEIDDAPLIRHDGKPDEGAFISAWVWVPGNAAREKEHG